MPKAFAAVQMPRQKETADAMFELAQFLMERYRTITRDEKGIDFQEMHKELMARATLIGAGLSQLALLKEVEDAGGMESPSQPTPMSRGRGSG